MSANGHKTGKGGFGLAPDKVRTILLGTATDHATRDQPPFIPDFPRMKAAAKQHNMQFMPDFQWPDPESDA